ncbi:MAG: DUF3108 domain-containing protein [Granulosicoccus sp.]
MNRMPMMPTSGASRLLQTHSWIFSPCGALLVTSLISLLCLGNTRAQTIEPGDIAPFEVVYEVGNHLITAGTAKLTLSRQDDLWSYSLNTTPRGLIKLAGKGKIDELSTIRFEESDGKLLLQPQTYRFRQDDERRRAVDATFDWENNNVTHVYRGEETVESFDAPVVDRLSATLLMMNALRREFQSTELQVFDTGRIKAVLFTNTGTETLKTPLGQIDTIRVTNENAQGGSRQTTTWFAPSLDYVPVKIEHRKRGELVARLTLKRLENRVQSLEMQMDTGK